ncbi:DUF5615 family PIN-like protein [Rhodohalobacter sp.]|uniref:DUF5615 family PIN-like protein n=1 Tax=Rhodohalobacter sp. TaxID=1974210 RepID=UPI002ACEA6B7|nr:DUF5615 family PIN-like protein [Rhodohalobacter sp.]MDZ7756249.1 DUF5615 family PIN-like protein [Rhodohalobacter sp.]
MKFLIVNNNLSYKLVEALEEQAKKVEHVKNAISVFASDIELWQYAEKKMEW